MHLFPSCHPLEPRHLLSSAYSMIDLGIVDRPLGSAVLDLNDAGDVLTPTAMWAIDSGKGKKVDIDPTAFTARKLGSSLTAAGASATTNQALVVRREPPHDTLRNRSVGPLLFQPISIANALGPTDNDPGNDTLFGQQQGDIINGRANDSLPDASADDIIPRAQSQGNSPFAVDTTSLIELRFPKLFPGRFPSDHTVSAVDVPAGAGDFSGSPFFVESDGVLRMRSQSPRDFTIGQFFDNWGIYVDASHFGGYVAPASKHPEPAVYINNQPFSRDLIVQPNDSLQIDVRL
jgi:hypothetical protein